MCSPIVLVSIFMLPFSILAQSSGTSQSVAASDTSTADARARVLVASRESPVRSCGESANAMVKPAIDAGLTVEFLTTNAHESDRSRRQLQAKVAGNGDKSARSPALSALTPAFAADKRNADAIIALLDDSDPDVRYGAAKFLPYLWRDDLVTALIRAYRRDGTDPRFTEILMDAAHNVSRPVLLELANDAAFCTAQANGPLLHTLAKVAIMSEEGNFAAFAATVLDSLPEDATEARKQITSGFAIGAIDNGRWNTLRRVAQARGPVRGTIAQILTEARAAAADSSLTPEARVQAIDLLGYDTFANAGELLVGLLSPVEAFEIQTSAVRALSRIGNPGAVPMLLDIWPGLAPQIRWKVMNAMTRDDVWTLALFDAVESGAITLESLMRWGFLDLIQSPNTIVRNRAHELLAKHERQSIDVIADTYQRLRLLQPNVTEGKTLFDNNCAKCHQLEGNGIPVGPDLGFMANAGEYALLKSILLPNLDVNPVYYSYTVETEDFEAFTGIVSREDADSLVILGPSAETHAVTRENISSVVSSEQTLMPEGWGESLGDQGLADLIGYMVDVASAALREQQATLHAGNP